METIVYLGIETYFNGCDYFDTVKVVFADEATAICWKEDWTSPDEDTFRTYEPRELL